MTIALVALSACTITGPDVRCGNACSSAAIGPLAFAASAVLMMSFPATQIVVFEIAMIGAAALAARPVARSDAAVATLPRAFGAPREHDGAAVAGLSFANETTVSAGDARATSTN